MRYLHLQTRDLNRLPAVVFVQGLMGYSFSWRHNIDFFARQREVAEFNRCLLRFLET